MRIKKYKTRMGNDATVTPSTIPAGPLHDNHAQQHRSGHNTFILYKAGVHDLPNRASLVHTIDKGALPDIPGTPIGGTMFMEPSCPDDEAPPSCPIWL